MEHICGELGRMYESGAPGYTNYQDEALDKPFPRYLILTVTQELRT